MRIHFISIHIEPAARAVPLGAAMIAQALLDQFPDTLTTRIIDCYLQDSVERNADSALGDNPDIVCFSIYLWNSAAALAMIARIKATRPGIIVVVGGALPTALPEQYAGIAGIDHVLTGEAEDTMTDLLRGIAAGIPQPTVIAQGTPPSPSHLPSPYLSGLIDPDHYHGALWELSRGCPYRCAFCFESRGATGIRRFPDERLQAELKVFSASGIPEILVLDPTFNYDATIAKRNLRMIRDEETNIHFTFEIRAEHIDRQLAELFAEVHCTLQIGLQSIHPRVLKKINRGFNQERFQDRVYLLHEQGIPYGFDLIYGLPGDTLDGFLASMDYAFGLAPNHVDIFPLAVIPGTALYDTAASHGLEFDPENEYIVEFTPSFSKSDMETVAGITTFAEYFYNHGKAVSWFDIVLSNLEMSPSQFFDTGSRIATEADYKQPPLDFQLIVLQGLSVTGQLPCAYSLLRDLVVYFWHYNGVFSESAEAPLQSGGLEFNPSLRIESFTYHPEEITGAITNGIDDFRLLEEILHRKDCLLALACTDENEISCIECTPEEFGILTEVFEKQRTPPDVLGIPAVFTERLISAGMATPVRA